MPSRCVVGFAVCWLDTGLNPALVPDLPAIRRAEEMIADLLPMFIGTFPNHTADKADNRSLA